MIETPYLLFLGDAPDATGRQGRAGNQGLATGKLRRPVAHGRLQGRHEAARHDPVAGAGRGRPTLVIGVANRGGIISPAWKEILLEALDEGFDIAVGPAQPSARRSRISLPGPANVGAACTTCAFRL